MLSGITAPATVPWSKLVYESYRADNWDLYLANGDGSGEIRLTHGDAVDIELRLNRGCSRIALASDRNDNYDIFQSYRDGQSEIYVMNADGSAQTRLTWDSAYDGQPAWSPDGAQIAFTSRRSGEAIWLMGADGSNQRAVAACRYAQHPVWSPDGSQIAFDADGDNDEWNEI
jgi:Tol biopolymer transport system component